MAATPRGATPRANGRGGYAVAESVQQALLYVRFRTAAEAGLKGDVHHDPLSLLVTLLHPAKALLFEKCVFQNHDPHGSQHTAPPEAICQTSA